MELEVKVKYKTNAIGSFSPSSLSNVIVIPVKGAETRARVDESKQELKALQSSRESVKCLRVRGQAKVRD